MFDKIAHVLFAIVGFITKLAPIGAMAFTIGKHGLNTLIPMAKLILTFYGTAVVFVIVILGGIARYIGFSIFSFTRYIKEELMIVLGTSSSESALPLLMKKLEHLGCAKPVSWTSGANRVFL